MSVRMKACKHASVHTKANSVNSVNTLVYTLCNLTVNRENKKEFTILSGRKACILIELLH